MKDKEPISAERGSAAKEIDQFARNLLRQRVAMLPESQQERMNRIFPDFDAIPKEDVPGAIDLVNRSIVANQSAF